MELTIGCCVFQGGHLPLLENHADEVVLSDEWIDRVRWRLFRITDIVNCEKE